MKQIIALLANGTVKYAIYDDGSEELTQFAEVLAPSTFGLEEAATLGINLATVVGLHKAKPLMKAPETAPRVNEPPALPSAGPGKGRGRPTNAALRADGRPRQRAFPAPKYSGGYIPADMVIGIINEHPEGITIPEIGEIIHQRTGEGYEWSRISTNNRLTVMRAKSKSQGIPMPVREERKLVPATGTVAPLLFPLQQERHAPLVTGPMQGELQSPEQA